MTFLLATIWSPASIRWHRFDTSTSTVPAGSFFVVKANEPHFEGSDGECLIIGTALGSWSTTELP